MDAIDELKIIIREKDIPCFSDIELRYYLETNGGDIKKTAYRCLLLKSENTTLNVSGLTTADSSAYFKRMASMYCPNNSGILGGL